MIQRIKKSLFVSSAILLGILYPFISSAGWVDNLRKGIGTYILFLVIKLAVNIAKFFTKLAGSLLNWVLSPNFISYSYTNPGGPNANPIIKTGLGVTQGFVNMLLVLILVYIAIATILRLAGYETKKLLITFIIVALLVNFAPVICGIIVDASNIVMNFFIQDLKADAFGATMAQKVEAISAGFDDRTEIESAWPFITQLAVMVPFLWVLTFILLLFTVIFILRYLVIWLLVILSPLAFACYILPMTRKYFDKWWEQFINWSFIGITCSFFLYLGLLLVTKIQAGAAVPAPTTGEGGLFDSILPYFVSAIFLGIGFVFGLQTSAIGASTVISGIKRGRKASTKWTRKKTWKGMALADRKIVPKILSKDEEGKRRLLQLTTARHAAEGITKTWESVPVVRWFRPEPLRRFAEFRSAIEDKKKEITGPSPDEIARVDKGVYTGSKAAAVIDSLVRDRGDSQDIIKYYMKKYKAESEEDLFQNDKFLKNRKLLRAMEFIAKAGNRGKVDRIDPRLALIGRSREEGWKAVAKATVNAKPADIAKMEREVPENKQILEIAMAFRGEDYFRQIGKLKGGVPARQKTISAIFSDFVDDMKLDSKKNKENWGKFMKDLSKKYNVLTPGIAKAITNPRMRSAGWGYEEKGEIFGAKYIPEEERKKPLEELLVIGELLKMGRGIKEIKKEVKKTGKPLKPGEKTKEEKENEPKK